MNTKITSNLRTELQNALHLPLWEIPLGLLCLEHGEDLCLGRRGVGGEGRHERVLQLRDLELQGLRVVPLH